MSREHDLDWTFIHHSSASFRTHVLKRCGDMRVEFLPTIGTKIFALLFIVVALGLLLTSIGSPSDHILELFGSIVFLVTGATLLVTPKVFIFDKTKGLYWTKKDKESPIPFHRIRAVQFLSEWTKGSESYRVSQINLCLVDGTRLQLITHSSHETLFEEAQELAVFLNRPLATVDS